MGELTWSDIEHVAELTIGQRDNTLWQELRRFRLTGSNFGKIYHALNSSNEDYTMIRSALFDPEDLNSIPAIRWGMEHELQAIESYQSKTHYSIKETGLWLFHNACLGASPDGLVYAGDQFVGIIEVKCPYRLREFQITSDDDMAMQLNFLTSDNHLTKSHAYYHQVQAEIYATKAAWCDFFVWCPSGYLNIRVYPDLIWQTITLPAIQNYFVNKILRPTNNPRQLVLQIELLIQNLKIEPIQNIQESYSRKQIEEIAQQTIGQSKNPTCQLLRPGRLSANLFFNAYITSYNIIHNHYTERTQEYAVKWAKAMFNYKYLPRFQWGNANEEIAIQQYEKRSAHKVTPTGMWLFPDSPLYSSPDGVIYSHSDPGKIDGILEVKCPIEFKHSIASDVKLDYIDENGELKHLSRYYFQVQGYLAATQALWCDFVIWGPDYFKEERIYPDSDWITNKLPLIKWSVNNLLLPLSYATDFWTDIMKH